MSDKVESATHDDKVNDPEDITIIVNTHKHSLPKNERWGRNELVLSKGVLTS